MRFFTPILAISAAAISIATATMTTPTMTTPAKTSGLKLIGVQFYEPLNPTENDNISINIEIEAGNVVDTCIAEWKYGKNGKKGYPTSFTVCAKGHFYFYFKSFSSISQWTLEAKYTYSVGPRVKNILGELQEIGDELSCGEYLNSNLCELADMYRVNGLPLSTPTTQ
ncbi:hypothetical protein BKA80DRAFT_307974 [Phyllosticta citrichinensis]